jgi:hypothetical protein
MFLNKFNKVVVVAVCVMSITACGKKESTKDEGSYTPSSDVASRSKIKYSSSISSQSQAMLDGDFDFLKSIQMSEGGDLPSLMKIDNTKPQKLTDWLDARVKLLAAKEFNYGANVRLKNASMLVDVTPVSATTVAINIGAAIYMGTKGDIEAYVTIPGFEEIKVESPRVGIMQEGEGLLQDLIGGGNLQDIPHRMFRLKTFFHEARHSDGHSDSLCFGHVQCPAGHNMAGSYACDNNNNGPYRIGAEFIRSFINSNKGLSAKQRNVLQTMVSDDLSRIQSKAMWDDAPAGKH